MSDWTAHARRLVDLGKARGIVTLDEVNEALGAVDPDQIEQVFEILEREGILVQDFAPPRREDPNDVPPEGTVSIEELMEMEGPPLKDATQQWYDVISRSPLLGREQERALAVRARQGNARARFALVEANLRLVVSMAKRYLGRGVGIQDLIQDGNLGLIKAVEKYKPDKGYRFSSYAAWWIRRAMDRAVQEQGRTIRLPEAVADEVRRLARTTATLQQKLKREPTQEEIAREMGVTEKRLRELSLVAPEPVSLEAPLGAPGDASLADFLEDVESTEAGEEETRLELRSRIDSMMEDLDDTARRIVRLRFGLEDGLPRTIDEIASELAITSEEVRSIEKQALARMRSPGVAGFEDAFN